MVDPIPCPCCLHEETLRARSSKREPCYDNLGLMRWHRPTGGVQGQVFTRWSQGWWECECGLRLPPFTAGILLDAVLMNASPNDDSIDAEDGVHADTKRAWKGGGRHG